jgi:TldD protein
METKMEYDPQKNSEFMIDYLKEMLDLATEQSEYSDALYTDIRFTNLVKDSTEEKIDEPFVFRGAVFRTFKKGEWREAAFSDLEKKVEIKETIKKLAAFNPSDHHAVDRISSARPWKTNVSIMGKRNPRDVDVREKLELIRHYFTLAKGVDSRIINVSVNYREFLESRSFVNSEGSELRSLISKVAVHIGPVAREGDRLDYDYFGGGRTGGFETTSELLNDEKVVNLAKGTLDLLGAKQVPSGTFDVVLDPGMTGTFAHESFGHGCEADQVLRGRSYLVNYLNKRLGPENFSLFDDGTLKDGIGSLPFDDEGIPSQKTPIVKKGVLTNFMQDRVSAVEMKTKPTGNGRRESYRRPVYVRMTNTYIDPGDYELDELLKEVKNGIYLEHWNSGIEDPIGGNMQLKSKRSWQIENGEIKQAYSSAVLSGKVLEFMKDIKAMTKSTDFANGAGYCGKGNEDRVTVGSGGTYLASRAAVGQG